MKSWFTAEIWKLLTIKVVNKDIKCKIKFCIQSLETVLASNLPPDPFKVDLFDNFCSFKVFDTILT